MKVSEKERQESIAHLRDMLKEGDRLYTTVNHVSQSGMTRYIKTILIRDNRPLYLDYHISKVLEWSLSDKYNGIKVGGCGMDMGFHLVYTLSSILFGRDGAYDLKQDWI